MADSEREWELHQPTRHREQAAALRLLAARLGRAGERDLAARQLLEARLLDLQAAALASSSRAA